MGRPRIVLPFALTALLGLMLGAGEPLANASAAAEDEQQGQKVLLQLKLKRGNKLMKHPGYMAELGEPLVLTLTVGDRTHEIEVLLNKSGERKFKAAVTYSVGGAKVLKGQTVLKAKAWGEVKAKDTVVSLRVDPDAKRTDGIDGPDGDDPLDGLQ